MALSFDPETTAAIRAEARAASGALLKDYDQRLLPGRVREILAEALLRDELASEDFDPPAPPPGANGEVRIDGTNTLQVEPLSREWWAALFGHAIAGMDDAVVDGEQQGEFDRMRARRLAQHARVEGTLIYTPRPTGRLYAPERLIRVEAGSVHFQAWRAWLAGYGIDLPALLPAEQVWVPDPIWVIYAKNSATGGTHG